MLFAKNKDQTGVDTGYVVGVLSVAADTEIHHLILFTKSSQYKNVNIGNFYHQSSNGPMKHVTSKSFKNFVTFFIFAWRKKEENCKYIGNKVCNTWKNCQLSVFVAVFKTLTVGVNRYLQEKTL